MVGAEREKAKNAKRKAKNQNAKFKSIFDCRMKEFVVGSWLFVERNNLIADDTDDTDFFRQD